MRKVVVKVVKLSGEEFVVVFYSINPLYILHEHSGAD
jgi:hypothetical protein